MSNSKLASERSVWLKEYCKRTGAAKAKSDKQKGPIIMIVIPLMVGGVIGYLIYNGGLNDPQTASTIKILAIIGGAILVFALLLTALGKKKNVTSRTEENLNELLTTEAEVKAFDTQMSEEPLFKVGLDSLNYFAVNGDYFYERFSDLGNETYTFVRIKDIASLHYVVKIKGLEKEYIIDFRDGKGDVLLNGRLDSKSKFDTLKAGLDSVISGLESYEEDSGE